MAGAFQLFTFHTRQIVRGVVLIQRLFWTGSEGRRRPIPTPAQSRRRAKFVSRFIWAIQGCG